MYQVDEQPMETIHLYVVREEEARSSLLPIILTLLALSLLIALSVLVPYQQPEIRAAIRVPAVLLPLKTFIIEVAVISTGVKTYPATQAHGILTLTNGSIMSEELPQGMILTSKDGIEVVTDAAVFVPAGNAFGYGVATVSAHALVSGLQGNIPTLAINQVYGTALYIRNLQAFTGGKDAYSVQFVTTQDRQNALSQARVALMQQTIAGLLYRPCAESVTGTISLQVHWTCQFVTYETPHLPKVRVLHTQVEGKSILLEIVFVARPRIFPGK